LPVSNDPNEDDVVIQIKNIISELEVKKSKCEVFCDLILFRILTTGVAQALNLKIGVPQDVHELILLIIRKFQIYEEGTDFRGLSF
jgi:hypothetical protein